MVCLHHFINLNKAHPKDNFLLPKIDQMVGATTSPKLLNFLDTISAYNQIFIDPNDEKTSFITKRYILLLCNAIWLKKCKSNLSASNQQIIPTTLGQNNGSLHRQHVGEIT